MTPPPSPPSSPAPSSSILAPAASPSPLAGAGTAARSVSRPHRAAARRPALPVARCTLDTPVGPLTLVSSGEALAAGGFCAPAVLAARLTPAQRDALRPRADLGPLSRAVAHYLAGQLDALDAIPVHQPGTPLQQEVWAALRAIPAGQVRTYTDLAAATGRPDAVRAAGTACGRNLVSPVVPCHRAQRRDGSLAGYYWGLDVKRWLLAHEARSA